MSFPEDPPEKWTTWVNTIQVELAIDGIESFSIREWQTTMIADLSIDRIADDLLRFRSNPVPDCTILARWIRVSKISAYRQVMQHPAAP
ncbi:Imm50 family immunity protein [Rhodococcus sp. TAF43]|uniref:Imm50 family immunity protein n=1 Tax=Rhodococcus sp. TAF43 TaxID=3237483 RepID=UPI003F953E21